MQYAWQVMFYIFIALRCVADCLSRTSVVSASAHYSSKQIKGQIVPDGIEPFQTHNKLYVHRASV
jgi:hypothetical protein